LRHVAVQLGFADFQPRLVADGVRKYQSPPLFRVFHPEAHRYSWWSQRFPTVRLNNKGWRIDYINVTNNLASRILRSEIYPDIKQSDHCPVFLELRN
jgi:exonuclease III